jgi:hypothetical protein
MLTVDECKSCAADYKSLAKEPGVSKERAAVLKGGSRPVCSVQIALEMVRAGWLVLRDGRFEVKLLKSLQGN